MNPQHNIYERPDADTATSAGGSPKSTRRSAFRLGLTVLATLALLAMARTGRERRAVLDRVPRPAPP